MGIAEVLVALIVIGLPTMAIFGIVARVYRHREKQLEVEARIAEAQAQNPEYKRELEERVRVLERIVTDQGHGIAHEIERLRDERTERPAALEKARN